MIRAVGIKKKFPKIPILDVMQLLTSAWSDVSEVTIKSRFRKVGISEKSVDEPVNNQDDSFKDLAAAKLEETISEFCERLPDEVPEELNAALLLNIDAELSRNGDKPSDAEILTEVRGEVIEEEEEDDIDVVYDETPAPPSTFEVEKVIGALQQFTLFCDGGVDLRYVLSNIFSQRVMAKRKKQKTIKDYFKL